MPVEWAAPFGDGMVLQRNVDGLSARLWGTAEPRSRFVVEIAGRRAAVRAGSDGRWAANLELNAGGPHVLSVDGQPRFRDVWVGDVWFCAGQSNMERSLAQGAEWPGDLVSVSGEASIRQLCLTASCDFGRPRTTLPARWIGADAGTAGFSAVAYAFAKRLWERTGVPQGLIQAAVGGSSAQAWLSARSLKRFPRHLARADWLAHGGHLKSLQAGEAARRDAWYQALDAADPKDPRRAGHGEWKPVELPSLEAAPFARHVGTVWLRRRFSLGQPFDGESRLSLGTLVEADDTWVNGVWVGGTGYQYPSRRYAVPAGVLRAENELLIRLIVPRGGGRITPEKPLKLWGGPDLELSGPWQWREGAPATVLSEDLFLPKEPLGLFNGVLAPLKPLTVRAVLWYQGESNTEDPSDYPRLLRAVAAEFRRGRRGLPFLAVQLPRFQPEYDGVQNGWADVRDAQRRLLELPRTGLAVALDQGEWNELHPAKKDEVGRRLALEARRVVLRDAVPSSPVYAGCRRRGDALAVRFRTGGSPLTSNGILGAFFFEDESGFRKADATIEEDIVVLTPLGAAFAVYYAWADNPAGAALVNAAGLPASPFRAAIPGARRRGSR